MGRTSGYPAPPLSDGDKVRRQVAAQHADIWHCFGTVEAWGRNNATLAECCARVGRDPAAIRRSASISDDRVAKPVNFLETLPANAESYVTAGGTDVVFALGSSFEFTAVQTLIVWRDSHAGQILRSSRSQ